MPKVGKKQFSYTKAGKKAAKAYAKESGQSVEKYYGGGGVDPFSLKNPESVVVKKQKEAIEAKNDMQNAIPTTNAMNRSQTSQVGNEVGTGEYKEGGFIKKTIEKYKDKKRIKELEKSLKGPSTPKGHQKSERELAYLKQKGKEPTYKITGIAKPKPKAGPAKEPVKVPSNPPPFKGKTVKEKFLNTSILYRMGKKAAKKELKGKKKK